MKKIFSLSVFFCLGIGAIAQGLVNKTLNNSQEINNGTPLVGCGSFDHMEHLETQSPGFLKRSDQFTRNLKKVVSTQLEKKTSTDVMEVPVVFHILHNNTSENLPDSVINNQLKILNNNFRRQNADTVNTRADFLGLVGDTRIQFKLADEDPNGNPTTGITRTNTPIQHFGGILPYAASQVQLIQQWVRDSLFFNFYRITQDSAGGKTAWDINQYVNIWIGDLRIFEPLVNNFEELVFFGLATPPINHQNWQDSTLQLEDLQQGILMHYVNIGANNPNVFPAPYSAYNGLVTSGKLLVHEVGHYLGLRHIWGDGDCSVDDFVGDTPRSDASSQYNCIITKNTCVDTINGLDLPDMVENYMDYSNGVCQNSFTHGQIDIMRGVLLNYRTQLATIGISEYDFGKNILHYPNPTKGKLTVELNLSYQELEVIVHSLDSKEVMKQKFSNNEPIQLSIDAPQGIYIVRLISKGTVATFKIIKS